MFVFDIETLGKGSDSVILSMAAVHFDPIAKTSPDEMRANAFFVKLHVEDQVKRLGRKMEKGALDWWAKQCDNAKKVSLIPTENDMPLECALDCLEDWAKQMDPDNKCIVWARGNLDQLVIDCAEEKLEREHIWPYNRWRDVRTAIDMMYDTSNGYCKVDYPGFDPALHITKHNPIDDCVFDAMQLMYGVKQ